MAETIHSGHFMVSNIHKAAGTSDDKKADADDDEEDSVIDVPDADAQSNPLMFYKFGKKEMRSISIDNSLNKLKSVVRLAYQDISTPKWKMFTGLKIKWEDRVRLNNLIWRAWFSEFVLRKKAKFCYFSVQSRKENRSIVVLEGLYWKRRPETVRAEYKRWRIFFMRRRGKHRRPCICPDVRTDIFRDVRVRRKGCKEQLRTSRSDRNAKPVAATNSANVPSSCNNNISTAAGNAVYQSNHLLEVDDYCNEFTDRLFESLCRPYEFPDAKEIAQAGYADIIQPGLSSLQPDVDSIIMASLGDLREPFFDLSIPATPEEEGYSNQGLHTPSDTEWHEPQSHPQEASQQRHHSGPPAMMESDYDRGGLTSLTPTPIPPTPAYVHSMETGEGLQQISPDSSIGYENYARMPPPTIARPTPRKPIKLRGKEAGYAQLEAASEALSQHEPGQSTGGLGRMLSSALITPLGTMTPSTSSYAELFPLSGGQLPFVRANDLQIATRSDLLPCSEQHHNSRPQEAIVPVPLRAHPSTTMMQVYTTAAATSTYSLQPLGLSGNPLPFYRGSSDDLHLGVSSPFSPVRLSTQPDSSGATSTTMSTPNAPTTVIIRPIPTSPGAGEMSAKPAVRAPSSSAYPVATRGASLSPAQSPSTNCSTPPVATRQRTRPVRKKVEPADDLRMRADETCLVGSSSTRVTESLRQKAATLKRVADSTHDPVERKRMMHISAEQTRRFALQDGFAKLREEIPEMDETARKTKVTKAMVLLHAAGYIRKKRDGNEERKVLISQERAKIDKLNAQILAYQDALSSTSGDGNRRKPAGQLSAIGRDSGSDFMYLFRNHIDKKRHENWKYCLYAKAVGPLVESFAREVTGSSGLELNNSAQRWLAQQPGQVQEMRKGASQLLLDLAREPSVLKDPDALRREAMKR